MDANTPVAATPKWMLWTGRVLSAVPVFMLTMSGIMKLAKPPMVLEGFAKFGYPESTITPIGVTEIVCVLLYLFPKTAVLGAILITGYLGGATATHVRASEPFISPIIIGMIAWGGLVLRDARLRSILPWRS